MAPHDVRALFWERVKAKGGPEKAGELVGCTAAYLYMIKSGYRTPSRDLAARIEDKLLVPMRMWVEDAA